jgi:hypothetical protein
MKCWKSSTAASTVADTDTWGKVQCDLVALVARLKGIMMDGVRRLVCPFKHRISGTALGTVQRGTIGNEHYLANGAFPSVGDSISK